MTAFDTLKSIEYGSFSPSLAFAGIDVVNTDYSYAAGKAVMYHYRLKLSGDDGRWSFPALFCRPKGNGPFPAVVNIGFERNVPNKYLPLEEIIDNGFAIAYFCYEDVISDSASFEDGIGELIHFDDKRPGKIAILGLGCVPCARFSQELYGLFILLILCSRPFQTRQDRASCRCGRFPFLLCCFE